MRTRLLALAFTVVTISIHAQAPGNDCNPDVDPSKCTIEAARDFYFAAAVNLPAMETQAMDETMKAVTNENRAVEVPDAFAGRVHNTYQDFLNLLGFAINKVDESENGQALTVRLNPLRTGLIAAGANLTVSKPVVSEALQNALPESGREDVIRQLEKQMGDTDSLKWSASATLQSVRCDVDREPSKRCYGRQAEAYREFLSYALLAKLMPSADDVDTSDLTGRIVALMTPIGRTGPIFDKSLTAQNIEVPAALPLIQELARREARSIRAEQKQFSKQDADRIGSLIDNQPQATLTTTYDAPGRFGGPEATTLQLELQYGNDNINAIRSNCKGNLGCIQTAFDNKMKNGVRTLKWVLSAAYKRTNNWLVPKDLGLKDPITGFDDFKLDRNRELSVKAQGGIKLGTKVGDEQMRADFSLEGQRVTVANTRKTNRWVAASTFTVPVGKQMSVPLTVNWANKSEFLPEESQKFGVHIGITYRIPQLAGMKGR